MKEYMPGQGSYKVEEGGALTGIPTSYDVDNHYGTLVFDRGDVNVSARGLDFALSSRFNSDHLYSTVIPKVSKSDGPAGLTGSLGIAIPKSLMTLPGDQTNFYRVCSGWSWKLPYIMCGIADSFKFSLGEGKIFDLLACITDEAWGGTPGSANYGYPANGQSPNGNNGSPGNHCWTEGFEVTYAAENTSGISLVTIVIPEIQIAVQVDIQRSTSSGFDSFTPLNDGNLKVFLADGRVVRFTANGFVSSITDPAGLNSLTFTYVTDALVGAVSGTSNTRKYVTLQAAHYAAALPGDLIMINGEIKVIFAKVGNNQVQVSPNFDTYIPDAAPYPSYTIYKGQLQMIAHTDGRAAKFYYYNQTIQGTSLPVMSILLSSDQNIDHFNAGDEFLGYYVFNQNNQLQAFSAPSDQQHATNTTTFPADLEANQASYFTAMQTVSYTYNISSMPSPATDYIQVTNTVGAPTIYYFAAGGFCSHSWNNAYLFKGTCRRGGTTTLVTVERPDFYFNPGSYLNVNRINQQAFYDASKADYQKDEHAAEFQADNDFNTEMFQAGEAVSAAGIASGFLGLVPGLGGGLFGALSGAVTGGASMALAAAQYQYTQAKYANDRYIAAHAGNVSAWVAVQTVINPNKIQLAAALAVAPKQNDVFGILNAKPDGMQSLLATSKDSTRLYVTYTNGTNAAFTVGDYVCLRTEMQMITGTGYDNFVQQNYVDVATPFSFIPDEGEQVAFLYAYGHNGSTQLPQGGPQHYCYYLNKPKVVRIEIHDSLPETADFWKRIDYEYDYAVQGSSMSDTFVDSGFTIDNIEGPNPQSFDASDITLTGTTVTTGISNDDEDIDYLKEIYTFSYDAKSFHKGADTVTTMRLENGGTQWLFVKKTVNGLGRPCYNAGYYGVMGYAYYEGGDPSQSNGGAPWRKKVDYRFDVYGRIVRERTASVSLEGKQNKCTFTQYVGSSPYLASLGMPDLDPLGEFDANYLSGTYQGIFNTFHALGLVGGTIEEVDAYGHRKCTFSEFNISTMNMMASDTLVLSSLDTYLDQLSSNNPNFLAYVPGSGLKVSDPTQIFWSYEGSQRSNDWSTAVFDDTSMTSHAVTYFTYDPATNNLLTITTPNGNVIALTYGSGYLSSYIATDVRTLDNNLGGTTQYVVNAYTYDVKGRMTSKITRFKTDTTANDTNLVSYGQSASKSEI